MALPLAAIPAPLGWRCRRPSSHCGGGLGAGAAAVQLELEHGSRRYRAREFRVGGPANREGFCGLPPLPESHCCEALLRWRPRAAADDQRARGAKATSLRAARVKVARPPAGARRTCARAAPLSAASPSSPRAEAPHYGPWRHRRWRKRKQRSCRLWDGACEAVGTLDTRAVKNSLNRTAIRRTAEMGPKKVGAAAQWHHT